VSIWETTPIVVGHRGGRGEGWPQENTIAAFDRARLQGAPAVELDTRTSVEGDAVVFHDVTLSRMTGGRDARRVCEVTARELRAIGIPLLAEALSWAHASGVAVIVEMKHDVPERVALARATVRAIGLTRADVLLSSFDPLLLGICSALAPSLPRALLVHAAQPRWADVMQRAIRRPWVAWLHIERSQVALDAPDPAKQFAPYMRRGLRLGVWTVNDPREAVDLVRLGVTSIITDAPGAVVEALSRN
jgi:glycerophosphoryl diester phosphodiesterase